MDIYKGRRNSINTIMTAQQRIDLILEITSLHPGEYQYLLPQYCYYVGGMADHGDWYYRKMLLARDEELLEAKRIIEVYKSNI